MDNQEIKLECAKLFADIGTPAEKIMELAIPLYAWVAGNRPCKPPGDTHNKD